MADIQPHEAAHVLSVFEGGGYPPGGFITKLLEAAAVADEGNLRRLDRGFPGYMAAVRKFKFEHNGEIALREIVRNGDHDG